MTEIRIDKKYIEVKGHSGYAPIGYDIVCSSISTLVQATYNYLLDTGSKVDYKEDNGYFKINITKLNRAGEKIINGFKDMVDDISIQYSKYIRRIK